MDGCVHVCVCSCGVKYINSTKGGHVWNTLPTRTIPIGLCIPLIRFCGVSLPVTEAHVEGAGQAWASCPTRAFGTQFLLLRNRPFEIVINIPLVALFLYTKAALWNTALQLLSLSKLSWASFHISTFLSTSFLLMALLQFIVWIFHNLFSQSLLNR